MENLFTQNPELFAAVVGAVVGGVIATLGSVAVMITSHYLRQAGKLTVTLASWKMYLAKSDQEGGLARTEIVSETESLTITLAVDLHSSSEVPKSLRQPFIEFKSNTKSTPVLLPPIVFVQGSTSIAPYKRLEVINLEPNKLVHMELKCQGDKKDIPNLLGKVTISLTALYPNGRTFRKKLITQDFNALSTPIVEVD